MPTISAVLKRSGYGTFHIVFPRSTTTAKREEILKKLKEWETRCEMVVDRFCTVETVPTTDHKTLSDYLKSLKRQGVLNYGPNTAVSALMLLRLRT